MSLKLLQGMGLRLLYYTKLGHLSESVKFMPYSFKIYLKIFFFELYNNPMSYVK